MRLAVDILTDALCAFCGEPVTESNEITQGFGAPCHMGCLEQTLDEMIEEVVAEHPDEETPF